MAKCNNCGWYGSKYEVLIKLWGNMYSCPKCNADMGNPITKQNRSVVKKSLTTDHKGVQKGCPEIGHPQFICTECGGDATIAFAPETIKRGKNKGKERASWNGLILPSERICMSCGVKRGLRRIF